MFTLLVVLVLLVVVVVAMMLVFLLSGCTFFSVNVAIRANDRTKSSREKKEEDECKHIYRQSINLHWQVLLSHRNLFSWIIISVKMIRAHTLTVLHGHGHSSTHTYKAHTHTHSMRLV